MAAKELTLEEIHVADSLAAEYFAWKDMLAMIGQISVLATSIELDLDGLIANACFLPTQKSLNLFLDKVDFAKKIEMIRALGIHRLSRKDVKRMNRLLERTNRVRIIRNECVHAVWLVETSGFPEGEAMLTRMRRQVGSERLSEPVLLAKLKRDLAQVEKVRADMRDFVIRILDLDPDWIDDRTDAEIPSSPEKSE